MALCGESFLQILQDESPVSYDDLTPVSQNNSLQWDNDDSFEVTEVTNAASSDINLAEALRSITTAHGSQDVQTLDKSSASEKTLLNGRNNLKEELKAKIQTRRKSEGVGELRVKFEAPKSYPLTPEERDKVRKRKHRNRLSANKSRLKRQQHEDNLRKELEDLETENDKLSKEVKFLQRMKGLLSVKMANHQCTKHGVTSSSIYTKRNVTSSSKATLSHQSTKQEMRSSSITNHISTKRNVTSSSLPALTIKHLGGRRTSTQTSATLQDVLSH